MDKTTKNIFFQSSLPRSGSTLLQNIIGQRPDFYVTPTSGVLELVFGARRNYTDCPEFKAQNTELMKKGFLNFCRQGVDGFFDAVTDKKYVLDKSRGWGIHYDFLNSFYPNPKIICMVRDPRSIFASMESNHRQSATLHHPSITDHTTMTGTSTIKRINIWANSQPVGLALERLEQMILQGIDKHVCFVRYEELLQEPQKTMDRVYQYLDVDPYQHNFEEIEQITQEDDSVYGIYGNHAIRPKLQTPMTDPLKILGPVICKDIRMKYAWFYEYFHYL